MGLDNRNYPRELDHMAPAANHAALGSTMAALIAAYNDLRTQYVALLAKLDTASVAGGTNAAQVSPTLAAVGNLGTIPPIP